MRSILVVAMYYPPAGGAGARRPLNLAKHLPALGFRTEILTPDDAKWHQPDPASPGATSVYVHRVRNRGPRTRLRGRDTAVGRARLLAELQMLPRRVLPPDPEIVWSAGAIRTATRLVRERAVDVVLTTSPPLSVHLIGAAVRSLTGARWIADLRDPLLASPYRRGEYRGERAIARLVVGKADAILAATSGIAEEVAVLGRADGVHVVRNGCDADEFAGLEYRRTEHFRITHTGSFLSRRDPRPFLRALRGTSTHAIARFVGDMRPADVLYARSIGLGERVQTFPFVSHREALALQRDSDALLLLVADADGRGHSVVTAKLSEYVASRRPILAAVPPRGEAARLLSGYLGATVVAPDDVDGITRALRVLEQRWRDQTLDDTEPDDLTRMLSGRRAAGQVAEVIRGLD